MPPLSTPPATRRSVLLGGAGAAGVVGAAAVAPPAAEAAPRPGRYKRTPVPSATTLHRLNRFTYGWTPALGRQVERKGGFEQWFADQLRTRPDPWYAKTSGWATSLTASPSTIWSRDKSGAESLWRANANYAAWTLVRQIGSKRQVHEVMAEFFEHHLHVPLHSDAGPYRIDYGKVIRARALTSYAEILRAAVLHPAMGIYLDNANSSKKAPNENLGRELLELHTVGVGNYTEKDVKNSARLLTGYRVDAWRTWAWSYDPAHHWTGPVQVVGFKHANSAADGRPALYAYLDHLAMHPATARRLARKLAVRFVSDTPSAGLVNHLAEVYLRHRTAIAPVLRALVAHREFLAARGSKVRTPTEDVVATYRALGARPTRGGGSQRDLAVLWQTQRVGLTPYDWPRPDGRPDSGADWASTGRFLGSLDVHWSMSGGWWPKAATKYVPDSARLPQPRLRFDRFVDHLCRTMLGRRSTPLILEVACRATGCRPGEKITARHRLVRWDMHKLLTVLLDNPIHMSR